MSLSGDPSALLDQILAAPIVRCDEVPWSFLSLSMANWNFVISFGMMITAVIAFFQSKPNINQDIHNGV